jgi:hypothetical protein
MSEHDVQQDEATPDTQEEPTAGGAPAEDSAVADNVDGLAVEHLSDSKPSPQPAGVEGDPIGEAEEHLASLDMDEERRKAADLMKKL